MYFGAAGKFETEGNHLADICDTNSDTNPSLDRQDPSSAERKSPDINSTHRLPPSLS